MRAKVNRVKPLAGGVPFCGSEKRLHSDTGRLTVGAAPADQTGKLM